MEPGDAEDAFVIGCRPGNENCPKEVGPDFDFGNAPILRTLPGGKRILVTGQKSGIVWGMDPDNEGKTVWQFKAGKGGALGGIEWGSAADEQAAYIPVSDVLAAPNEAGGLFALKLATGEKIWSTPAPKLECNSGRGCTGAQSAPVSVIPGVVFSGSVDGHMRAYSTVDGSIIWDYNTAREFETVNHVPAKGGSIDSAGPVIADGLLLTNSGYALWRGTARERAAGVLGEVATTLNAEPAEHAEEYLTTLSLRSLWSLRSNRTQPPRNWMPETNIRVDAVMSEIERDVRTRLRRHLIKRGGAADYHDEEIFEAVRSVLARAVDERNLDATLLPELLDTRRRVAAADASLPLNPSPGGRAVHPVRKAAHPAADDALAVRVQPGQFPPPGSSQPSAVRLHRGAGARERPPSPRRHGASAQA